MKTPPYLTENLPGGELSPVLWRWPLGLLSQKERKKETVGFLPIIIKNLPINFPKVLIFNRLFLKLNRLICEG